MPLNPQQEAEIYPILDRALDLAFGKGALHQCTAQRADYLTRMIQGLRYDSAIESIEMYKPGDPLYGLGLYSCLWVEPHEQGLLATMLPNPPVNLMWRLIQCAAFHESVELPNTRYNSARQRLVRAQKKYPEIMNSVYISSDKNGITIAKYGIVTAEEVLVVDIDVKPDSRIRNPTEEDVAKAGHPMQNPPKWR